MARNRSVRYVDLGYSSAREWWDEVGLPAHRRFVDEGSRQTAVDACMHAWHVHEWHWHEMNPGSDTRGNADFTKFQHELVTACPELEWVRDFADASKHRGLGRPGTVTAVHNKRPVSILLGLRDASGRSLMSPARPVTLELTDETTVPLSEVLETVVSFWNERLGTAPVAPG